MNVELEALLKAFDAYMETTGDEAKKVRELEYESRLDSVLERFPHLSRATLEQAIRLRYRKWVATETEKPSTLPPSA